MFSLKGLLVVVVLALAALVMLAHADLETAEQRYGGGGYGGHRGGGGGYGGHRGGGGGYGGHRGGGGGYGGHRGGGYGRG